MQEPSPALSRRTFVGGATALAAASLAFPQAAFAVTAAEKQAEAITAHWTSRTPHARPWRPNR